MSAAKGAQRGFLPYGRHQIEDDDIAAVAAVLRGAYLTTGPTVEAFEEAFRAYVGAPHAVVCANGTAALHLAALALELGPEDVVIVPSVTFLATANAIRFVGGEVAFADVDPETGLLGPEQLAAAIGRAGNRVRAAFVVHLNGQTSDSPAIAEVARNRELSVVEDACHALGTRLTHGGTESRVGDCAHADLATFSFHPVKTIATGEGGMVTSRDPGLAERLRRLRAHGMVRAPERFEIRDQAFAADGSPNPWYYEMPEVGFNYRANDMQCALGLSQLAKIDRFSRTRRQLARRYDERLKSLGPIVRPIRRTPECDPVWHLYVVLIDFAALDRDRAQVMRVLQERGIGTQVHYIPVHRQPYYRRRYGDLDLPGADAYYARALTLPLFAGMDEGDVDRVVDALSDLVRKG
jgi:UDP-4-amino-4,6-dideoxy-N-acetyl-beta-L-altrosamine transaminase